MNALYESEHSLMPNGVMSDTIEALTNFKNEGIVSTTKKTKKVINMRWSPAREWLVVAYGAKPHLDAGADRYTAVKRGQQLLPRSRRAYGRELERRCFPSAKALDRALEQLRTMSNEQIVALIGQTEPEAELPAAAPRPVHIDRQDGPYVPRGNTRLKLPTHEGGSPIRWQPIEWALLARRAQRWHEAGSNAGLVRLAAEAQEIELPEHRRRPYGALGVNAHKAFNPFMERGGTEWAHLVADIPYDPWQTSYVDRTQAEAEAAAAPIPTAAPVVSPEPVAPPVEAPRPLAAPTPANHEAARVFGEALAKALVPLVAQMMAGQEQELLERVYAQQRAQGEQLAADMSKLLLEGMDRMLGGSPPAAPPPPEPEVERPDSHALPPEHPDVPTPEHPQSKALKVDVVGFEHGHHKMLVERKLNGAAVDLRFVHPDAGTGYQPQRDRQVILLVGRTPHGLQNRIKAAGCTVHKVQRTVTDVVDAVHGLMREQAH